MTVKVVTDSTAYITDDIIKKLDITVISLAVNFPTQTFQEVAISNNEFYQLMEQSPVFPTSSQPPPVEFYEAFKKIIEKGDQVIGVFLSSELSGTFSSAQSAKKMILAEYPDAQLELIDSRGAAALVSYGVIAGAKAAQEGVPFELVSTKIKETINKSRLYFVPETLEYLKKGGRIGTAAALIGNLLHLKPILTIENGKAAVYEKVRTSQKAVAKMLETFVQDHQRHVVQAVTVLHINNLEAAKKFALQIVDVSGLAVEIGHIGPVIGLHVGPGTLGIAYYTA